MLKMRRDDSATKKSLFKCFSSGSSGDVFVALAGGAVGEIITFIYMIMDMM